MFPGTDNDPKLSYSKITAQFQKLLGESNSYPK